MCQPLLVAYSISIPPSSLLTNLNFSQGGNVSSRKLHFPDSFAPVIATWHSSSQWNVGENWKNFWEGCLNDWAEPWLVWLSWLEHHPADQKVTGLIPDQGGFGPGWGTYERQLIDVSLPLSPSLLLSLKISGVSSHIEEKKKQHWAEWILCPHPSSCLETCSRWINHPMTIRPQGHGEDYRVKM